LRWSYYSLEAFGFALGFLVQALFESDSVLQSLRLRGREADASKLQAVLDHFQLDSTGSLLLDLLVDLDYAGLHGDDRDVYETLRPELADLFGRLSVIPSELFRFDSVDLAPPLGAFVDARRRHHSGTLPELEYHSASLTGPRFSNALIDDICERNVLTRLVLFLEFNNEAQEDAVVYRMLPLLLTYATQLKQLSVRTGDTELDPASLQAFRCALQNNSTLRVLHIGGILASNTEALFSNALTPVFLPGEVSSSSSNIHTLQVHCEDDCADARSFVAKLPLTNKLRRLDIPWTVLPPKQWLEYLEDNYSLCEFHDVGTYPKPWTATQRRHLQSIFARNVVWRNVCAFVATVKRGDGTAVTAEEYLASLPTTSKSRVTRPILLSATYLIVRELLQHAIVYARASRNDPTLYSS
jgi:hypothetical protein